MGSRRRLNRNARAQHEFLLTNEDSARRKRDARKRRKAVKREDISLANALSGVSVGGPVEAPKVGAPLSSGRVSSVRPTTSKDESVMSDSLPLRSAGIRKSIKVNRKRRQRQAKIAARAQNRLQALGVAMSNE